MFAMLTYFPSITEKSVEGKGNRRAGKEVQWVKCLLY